MKEFKQKIEKFFKDNQPVIIVNTSTDSALVCLDPVLEEEGDLLVMKFDSLNDRGGNSVMIKAIQGEEEGTLYIENESENVLMLQSLSLENYRHYIQPQYANSPSFSDLDELKKFVKTQVGVAF